MCKKVKVTVLLASTKWSLNWEGCLKAEKILGFLKWNLDGNEAKV